MTNPAQESKNTQLQQGYKSLPFFQQAEVIYDFTYQFCSKYISKTSRTVDQMVQAARSGKQNISEGYLQKSMEGRIKLLNVARGSLEELLNDYQDFLRQRGLKLWGKDSFKARKVRALGYKIYKSYTANAAICLINQTNALLDNKLRLKTIVITFIMFITIIVLSFAPQQALAFTLDATSLPESLQNHGSVTADLPRPN